MIGAGPEAAPEHQRLIDHRGVRLAIPCQCWPVMAWLGVMRSPGDASNALS